MTGVLLIIIIVRCLKLFSPHKPISLESRQLPQFISSAALLQSTCPSQSQPTLMHCTSSQAKCSLSQIGISTNTCLSAPLQTRVFTTKLRLCLCRLRASIFLRANMLIHCAVVAPIVEKCPNRGQRMLSYFRTGISIML